MHPESILYILVFPDVVLSMCYSKHKHVLLLLLVVLEIQWHLENLETGKVPCQNIPFASSPFFLWVKKNTKATPKYIGGLISHSSGCWWYLIPY